MIGAAVRVVVLLIATALPALAQDAVDRPPARPDMPAPAAEAPAPTTPPDAPPDASPDAPQPDAALADAPPEPAAAQPFGPPPPPVWFTLAESDAEFAACQTMLTALGTRFTPEPSVTDPDNRDCGIARPLRVSQILPGIALTGEPVMRCTTAQSLALWTLGFARPAAALRAEAAPLTALQTGPAYSCRDRVGTGEADPKPSEHGYGNAVDVMGFVFGDATVPVQPRTRDGDTDESFQAAVQGAACLLFTTVMGPGSNAAHDNNLHLDMAARGGGWRLCE